MRRSIAVAVVMCMGLIGTGHALANGSSDHRLFPPQSSPRGMTYQHWASGYEVWLNGIPAPNNPFRNPASRRNCELHHGVVYLGPLGADCEVPLGHPLLFMGAFWECSTLEGLGDTWRELRTCAKERFAHDFERDGGLITLRIDGKTVLHPRAWVLLTHGEILHFPHNNIWGAPGGRTKSVTKAPFYMLRPLTAGDHTIREHVHVAGCCTFNFDWTLHAN